MKNIRKKLTLTFFVFLVATSFASGKSCLKVIKAMDRGALSSDYKKIAYYTYLHKKKLDYIQKSYALLSKIKNQGVSETQVSASTTKAIMAIPTVAMAKAEVDALDATNKVNLTLLQLLLYRSIKNEIKSSNFSGKGTEQ